MKKKKSIKSTNIFLEILITVVCLAGIAASLFVFKTLLYKSLASDSDVPVGMITFKKKSPRRRLQRENVWEYLNLKSTIYQGDYILTEDNSEAELHFTSENSTFNSSAEIHPNSMIHITNQDKLLHFISGSLSINTGTDESKIAIQAGDTLFVFDENSSALISMSGQINKNNQQALTIFVNSGNVYELPASEERGHVVIPSDFTNRTKISQGEISTVEVANVPADIPSGMIKNETSKAAIKKNKFNVLMPPADYSITPSKEKNEYVPFYWTNENDITVEFSYAKNFAKLVAVEKLHSEDFSGSVLMDFAKPEDIIYWRAYPTDKKDLSVSGKILVNNPEEKNAKVALSMLYDDATARNLAEQVESSQKKIEENKKKVYENLKPSETEFKSNVNSESNQTESATAPEKTLMEQVADSITENLSPLEKMQALHSGKVEIEVQRLEEQQRQAEEDRRIAEQKAEEERQLAEEAARIAEEQRIEAERILAEKKAAEEKRKAEEAARIAEQQKKEAERKLAEQKAAEEKRKTEEALRAAERQKKEAERLLAEQKAAEEKRKAEEKARIAEQQKKEAARKLAEQKAAEEKRKAEEAALLAEQQKKEAERKLAEKKAAEEELRKAEEAALLAEQQRKEAERLLAEQTAAEELRKAQEAERLAEEQKKQAEKLLAEQKAAEEELRRAEEQKKETERLLAEQAAAEELRKAQEAERLAEEQRIEAERLLAEQAAAEELRKTQEAIRLAEEQRIEAERLLAEQAAAEELRKAQEAERLAEEQRIEAEHLLAEQAAAEEMRKAQEAILLAEEQKKEAERLLAEQAAAEELRKAQEAVRLAEEKSFEETLEAKRQLAKLKAEQETAAAEKEEARIAEEKKAEQEALRKERADKLSEKKSLAQKKAEQEAEASQKELQQFKEEKKNKQSAATDKKNEQLEQKKQYAKQKAEEEFIAAQKAEEQRIIEMEKRKAAEELAEQINSFTSIVPALSNPKADASFTGEDFTDDEPSILFNWQSIAGAKNYVFEIRNSRDETILLETLTSSKYVLSEKIDIVGDDGVYFWYVYATKDIADQEYKTATACRNFSVNLGILETASLDMSNFITE